MDHTSLHEEQEQEEIIKEEGTGLTGLANLGNTCFMNTALQCLVHSESFNKFLSTKKYEKKLNKNVDSLILVEYNKLRKMMWSEDCVIGPGGFLTSIQKVANIKDRSIFTGFAQNDLTEFLIFLIDCFHNSIAREVDMEITGDVENETDKVAESCYKMLKNMYSKEYSEILELFYGISVSQIFSTEGKKMNFTPEPFLLLDLALPSDSLNLNKPTTLNECLDIYTQNETLEDDNLYEIEKGKEKIKAHKKIEFWKLPEILIISIKRFSNKLKKNQSLVDFPLADLDMSKYVIGYNKNEFKYDLYGVCNHVGGTLGGHYYAYIKNNNDWHSFNDGDIEKIDNSNIIVSPTAYCLFYHKKK